jgi:hypothetical protein
MARRSFAQRVEKLLACFEPASPIGGRLVELYVERISAAGSHATQRAELALLRELCRMLSVAPLPELSVATLDALWQEASVSDARRVVRRRVVGRVVRILQERGELPDRKELHYNARLQLLVTGAPDAARANLRVWLAQRQHRVSPYELYHEARRLLVLEAVLADEPMLAAPDAISAALRRIVHQIAACPCPPVTRSTEGSCRSCQATPATHGAVPSPGVRKQREFRSLAAKYLAARRPHTTTTRAA